MTIATAKKRVVFYGRISDADDAIGVDRQKKLGLAMIDQHEDWDLVAALVDNNRSAKDEDLSKRPDYQKLLQLVDNEEVDIVVAYHGDRISRNGVVIEQFLALADKLARKKKHPILFHPVRGNVCDLSTADGQKAFRDTGSGAIHESAHKAERVRERIDEQITEGMLHGGFRPYGIHRASKTLKDENGNLLPTEDGEGRRIPQRCPSCKTDMKVTIRGGAVRAVVEQCPVEQERLQWFAERWVAGDTLYGMAQYANKKGWPTVRGGQWRANTIKTILGNDISKGKRSGTDHLFGALLPEELQKALLQAQAVPRPRGKKMTPTLLGGLEILKCGVCGSDMQASQKAKDKLRYGCIKAPGRDHCCGKVSIMRGRCEETVMSLLVDALKLWRSEQVDVSDSALAEKDLVQVEADLKDLAYQRFTLLPVEDRLSDDEYKPVRSELVQRKKALEGRIAAAVAHSTDAIPHDGIDEWWASLNPDQKRRVLKAVVEKIEVAPSPAGRVYNPERVHLVLGSWITDTMSDSPAARKLRNVSAHKPYISQAG